MGENASVNAFISRFREDTVKTLDKVDLSDAKSRQRYEDLLRKRFHRIGYRLSKGKSFNQSSGFRIINAASDAVIAGDDYGLSVREVEEFWLAEYNRRNAEKQKRLHERAETVSNKMRPKTVKIDNRWTITNDNRAIRALNDHISRYGNFDAHGHGTGGDITAVMYRAYRPYACPQFSRVWPIDGNWSNLTDCNLRSDADEATLPDGVVPITTQRRIWHDGFRICVKLPINDQVFFTEWNRELFNILSTRKILSGWYLQTQCRKTKTALRLYSRISGSIIISFAGLVALFDAGKVDLNNILGSLLAGKKWMQDNQMQVDHLRDNAANNTTHNLAIMPKHQNGGKSDMVTEITAPFAFIPVRIGESFRILLGKYTGEDWYSRYIICNGVGQFLECLSRFYKIAKDSGEMLPMPEDHAKTSCISQMLCDDGQEYHGEQYNPIEGLLRAEESVFTPWDGDVSLLHLDTERC